MKRIQPLDAARFIAALSVLCFHYFWMGIQNGKIISITHIPVVADIARFGYLGVELFFMISGYVIFFSARDRTASEFAVSRALRLYPAFWAAVLITTTVALFCGQNTPMAVSAPQVAASMTMVPELLGFAPVDGVYWTLAYELTFYSAVFLCLLLGLQRWLAPLLLLWPVGILAVRILDIDVPLMHGYYCYFAAGAAFAIQKDRVTPLTLASLAGSLYLCLTFTTYNSPAPYIVGAVVTAFFGFFFLLNLPSIQRAKIRGSRLMGGMTYPIYLVHAHIGYIALSRFATEVNKSWIYPLVIIGVLATAYALHVLVEKALAKHWSAFFTTTLGRAVEAMSNGLRRCAAWCMGLLTA